MRVLEVATKETNSIASVKQRIEVMGNGVWVGWIRQYRPLRNPVNLRQTQAENENASTPFRGYDHSTNDRPSTCTRVAGLATVG